MFYVQRGQVPHKRHTQFRKENGDLYAEELFGVEGFAGRSSLLYHDTPPTQAYQIEKVGDVELQASDGDLNGQHRHHLVNTGDLQPSGDAISGRIPLFFNNDVTFGVVLPAEPMSGYYRNGELIDHKAKADEALARAREQGVEVEKVLVWRRHPGQLKRKIAATSCAWSCCSGWRSASLISTAWR